MATFVAESASDARRPPLYARTMIAESHVSYRMRPDRVPYLNVVHMTMESNLTVKGGEYEKWGCGDHFMPGPCVFCS